MKKILSVLLAVMLIATCFTTVAFAASDVTIFGSKTAMAGQTVDVTVTISGDHAGYGMYITASDPLTITNISGTEIYVKDTGFIADATKDNVSSRTFTVTVKVAENAAAGNHSIDVDVDEIYNAAIEDLDPSIDVYVKVEAPECDHDYVGKVTTEPGCETEGVKTFTCSKCGDSYTESIPAKGHDYKSVVTKPGCETEGYTTYTCANCGDSYTADKTAALGHDWDNGTVTKEPTKDTEGEMTYTCKRCGETKTDVIPALGGCKEHKWNFNDLHVDVEPTCTEAGKGHVFCTECGERMDVTLDALGHTYDKNDYEYDEDQHWHVCDRCGEEIGHEDHVFNKHNGLCECGYKDPTWKPAVNPDDDDLPKTGDITAYITFAAATMICMVAAAGYVFKRNFLK